MPASLPLVFRCDKCMLQLGNEDTGQPTSGHFGNDGADMYETIGCNLEATPQQVNHCCPLYSLFRDHWLISSVSGTLFRASQFLSEELPIRLAHRVEELADLPDGLNEMPSIKRVQDWYAQSFEVRLDKFNSRQSRELTFQGNHNPPKTKPQHRSQRASFKTNKESESRKSFERGFYQSEHKAWPV